MNLISLIVLRISSRTVKIIIGVCAAAFVGCAIYAVRETYLQFAGVAKIISEYVAGLRVYWPRA